MKRALLIFVCVIVVGSLAAQAQGSGQVVGVQCWIGNELRGGFPPNYICPVTSSTGQSVIMGPPVIVWRHPSAEGSQMPGLSPVDSRLASQLNTIADTPTNLRYKAEFAMKNGDLMRAKLYLDEARRRDPQDPDIQESSAKLQHLFDNGPPSITVPRLQLSKPEFLQPMPDSIVNKYVEKYPEVKELRKAEISSYNQLANTDAAFNTTMNNFNAGTATQSDVDQTQSKLNSAVQNFKKAQTELQKKIYVLDGGIN
jgi:hypothetical protein